MFQSEREGGAIVLRAPCKINLHLSIGGRRPDGFHELESVFTALDLADTLTFTPLPGREGLTTLSLVVEGPRINFTDYHGGGKERASNFDPFRGFFPPIRQENNLVWRAAELFRAKTGFSANLAVELVKRIPPGSGLGGGSSDAAATLLALNTLANEPLSRQELLELAAQLGSDVPFFVKIAGGREHPGGGESPACAVSGRGEVLEALPPPPPLGVLLAFPGFASDTAAAYKLLDAFAGESHHAKAHVQAAIALQCREATSSTTISLHSPTEGRHRRKVFDGIWEWHPPETWDFSNDFLDLFLNHGTEREKQAYSVILKDLRAAGAAFAGLSGSGSACFGVFPGLEAAEKARQGLSGAFYTLKSTFFLHSPKTGSKIK